MSAHIAASIMSRTRGRTSNGRKARPKRETKNIYSTMKHIESDIERACRAYARERGWVCWKNEKNGNKGIPDDTFLSPDGIRFLLIEFKKDEKAYIRPEQITWKNRYPNVVFFVSSLEQFKKILLQ